MAMLIAIMAMFEMANGLMGQQIFADPPKDAYISTVYQSYDKSFLKLLTNLDESFSCSDIRAELSSNSQFSDIKSYQLGVPSPSVHERFIGACALSLDTHRVLIVPSSPGSATSHQLFSCVLRNDSYCTFERAKG